MKNIYKSLIIASLITFGACENNFENDVKNAKVTSGEADFSKYIALGNSLTSGYADGTLYRSAQESSYPAIIAKQMQYAGGGAFTQPLMPDNIGGFSDLFQASQGSNFYGKLTLKLSNGQPAPTPSQPSKTLAETFVKGPFSNLGVPGAKSYHLLADGYGNPQGVALGLANPYFARFASTPSTSVIKDALSQSPTFFTLWIGNNDVLGYASGGAAGVDQKGNIDPSTYATNDLSDTNVVVGSIQKLLENLTKNGAKGAIANLPNVQDIPFFTTIPSTPLNPNTNKEYAKIIPVLNEYYSNLNKVYDALGAPERKITFNPSGDNGVLIKDESLTNLSGQIYQALVSNGYPQAQAGLLAQMYGQTRLSKKGDLFPLTMSRKIGKVDEAFKQQLIAMGAPESSASKASIVGISLPINDEGVLTVNEIETIKNRISEINKKIEQLAHNYNLAYVDMNKKMMLFKAGMTYNGATYNTAFIKGGSFSLDGVHLNSRGYAITANFFIEAINNKYSSNIPLVDVNSFKGIDIP